MLYHDICDQDMDQAIGSLPGGGESGVVVGVTAVNTKRGYVYRRRLFFFFFSLSFFV